MTRVLPALVVLAVLLRASAADAQPLGTFRWQLQPYCNVVSLAVTQNGGLYEIAGTDDQCGAGKAASAIGTAFLNPDGTIGFGLTIVGAPSGAPIHVEASISLATLSGTWHDSAGGTGAFVFTPGGGIAGSPRPASAVAPGSITAASIAPSAIGRTQVDSSQVQLRIAACPPDTFLQTVHPDGAVNCASYSLPTNDALSFTFDNIDGFVAKGLYGAGHLPAEGEGTRAMWYPRKAAFRAGTAVGAEWNDANVGAWSTGFGHNVTASGTASFAAGANAYALGSSSIALGFNVAAVGEMAVALGSDARSEKGAFTFADRSVSAVLHSDQNQFNVRATGGVGFYTSVNLGAGVELAPGASSWSSVSDVNRKENFRDLAGEDVLTKIAGMPIREWNYKAQDAAIRHVGPTAQDFHAAFGLGEDPLRISTIDADGVALAGVKALDTRTREAADAVARQNAALQEELAALKAEIASLRSRLDALDVKR